jgi:tetratricopeptide (TPR) repeat protein
MHPVHVESVAWITERKNTLSALFYLLSFGAYLKFAGIGSGDREPRWKLPWYGAALVLFVCALFSKTVTCTLPVVVLIALWARGDRRLVKHAALLAPLVVLGAVMGLATAALEVEHVGAVGGEWDLSPAQRILVAGRVVWFYVGKLLWPAGLAFVYARWEPNAAAIAQWLWPAAAVAAGVVLWVLRRRLGRGPIAAFAIYVVTLSPALGFINVFPMRYSFVADHFAYLASVPVIVLAASVVARSLRRIRATNVDPRLPGAVAWTFGAAVLVALATLTWHQAGWYAHEETLWRATIRSEPEAAMPHYNLAKLLMTRGDPQAMEDAAHHFGETLRIKPDAGDVHENLGLAFGMLGRLDEAAEQLELALAAHPDDASAHGNLGSAYRLLGRPDDAIRHYEAAVRHDPDHAPHYLRLARALAENERLADAIRTMRAGVERIADSPPLRNTLAAYLCRATDPSLRDASAAVFHAERACLMTGNQHPAYLHTLADALVEAGRIEEARTVARTALDLARARGDTDRQQRLRALLDRLDSGHP